VAMRLAAITPQARDAMAFIMMLSPGLVPSRECSPSQSLPI
jgi:hypothetical protein